jgi:DNA polymerase III subunit delta
VLYLLYGPDAFGVHEATAALRARLVEADPMADLNRAALDGRGLTVGALQSVCDALPFLGDRRLVVVTDLLAQTTGRKELADALIAYLPHMPATTLLVLVEGSLAVNHRLLRWIEQWRSAQPRPDEAAVVRRFEAPRPERVPGWLDRRARDAGGAIEPAAAQALAVALTRDGDVDLYRAASEVEKLLVHAGDRPVTAADVAALVTPITQDSVFRLMDALAERDGRTAATLLHRFLGSGEAPLRLLALMARQFRLVIHARALLDGGTSPGALAAPLGVPPFVAGKLAVQARRFTVPALEAAHRRLLDIDTAIKTGRTDPVVALDLFIAEICPPRGVRKTA